MTESFKKGKADINVLTSILVPLMEGEGVDPGRWKACAEELIQRNHGDSMVPATQIDALWETFAPTEDAPDPVLAARLGTRLRPYRLGPLGQQVMAAKNGLELLETLGNMIHAFAPSTRVIVQQHRCALNYAERGAPPASQWPQFAIGHATAMLAWLAQEQCVIGVELRNARESVLQDLEELYGCPVATGCPEDALLLRMDRMTRPFDWQG